MMANGLEARKRSVDEVLSDHGYVVKLSLDHHTCLCLELDNHWERATTFRIVSDRDRPLLFCPTHHFVYCFLSITCIVILRHIVRRIYPRLVGFVEPKLTVTLNRLSRSYPCSFHSVDKRKCNASKLLI